MKEVLSLEENKEVEGKTGKQPPALVKNNKKDKFQVLVSLIGKLLQPPKQGIIKTIYLGSLEGWGDRNTCPNVRSFIKSPPVAK